MQIQAPIADIAEVESVQGIEGIVSSINGASSFQALAPITRIYKDKKIPAELESPLINKIYELVDNALDNMKNRSDIQSFSQSYNSLIINELGWEPRNKPAGIRQLESKILDKIDEITKNSQQPLSRSNSEPSQIRNSDNNSSSNNLDYLKSRIESAKSLDDLREPVVDFAHYKEDSQIMSSLSKRLKILVEREMGCIDYSKHYIEKLEKISKSYESFFQNSRLSNSNPSREIRKKLREQIETVRSMNYM